jgi:hypothetical protein
MSKVNAIMDGEGKMLLQGRPWQKLLMIHTAGKCKFNVLLT